MSVGRSRAICVEWMEKGQVGDDHMRVGSLMSLQQYPSAVFRPFSYVVASTCTVREMDGVKMADPSKSTPFNGAMADGCLWMD